MLSKNKGITLVSLVITIIVMLILAGVALSSVTGDNSILAMASKTSVTQKLATYKEEFELSKTAARMEGVGQDGKIRLNDFDECLAGEDVKKYIPSLKEEDYDKIAIFNGKILYASDRVEENDEQIITDMDIGLMSSGDYTYLIYMTKLMNFVKKAPNKIGNEITSQSEAVTIAGITYSLGWYKIETNEQLKLLGFTQEELDVDISDEDGVKKFIDYGPFIVQYEGEYGIQSSEGKKLYAGTDEAVWKTTFNYTGNGSNSIAVNNLLSGKIKNSVTTPTQFGEFVPNKTPAPSGASQSIINNYYKDSYTYDDDNGVILTTTTNILSMPIDSTKELNRKISVNVTFKADLMTKEQGKPSYGGDGKGGCLLAISNLVSQDICSIRVRQGYLTVITFRDNNAPEAVWNKEESGIGYTVIDVKKYNNKYMNVNVVAERGGQTKVYINGSLASTFQSGSTVFTEYNSFTIGDLRSGRGMKFVGNVYNFGLYGGLLTPEEVNQNWQYTKKELGINEAGDKVK